METNKTKNTDLFLIDPRNIVVVDGFNVRRDFDLDELKEQIKAKGVLNPLTVIAFKDDEGNEKSMLLLVICAFTSLSICWVGLPKTLSNRLSTV